VKGQYRKYGPKSSRNSASAAQAIEIPFDRETVDQLLREELHSFAIEMGRIAVIGLLEDEVSQLCGAWHVPIADRTMTRYGAQPGWVAISGQKVAIPRPRVRRLDGKGEVKLARYKRFQQPQALPQAALRRMIRGVSCRDYEAVVDCARTAFGVKRSSVSRNFAQAMAGRIKRLSERRWDGTRFVAIFIDGKAYAGQMMIVAIGVKTDGTKVVLGLRQGATENAEVVKDLLEDMASRGVAVQHVTLFVLDWSKALASAVRRVWGRYALIQRCQVHKCDNIKQYLAPAYWPELERRLNEAWSGNDYETSLASLKRTADWLEGINPDAAKSLREGMPETLTVVRLCIPLLLRQSLSNTNIIESAFSVAATAGDRVKRWRRGVMRWRWCAAGLLQAEERFRRLKGHLQIPQLMAALDAIAHQEGLDSEAQVA
jgi:transposase-like protein